MSAYAFAGLAFSAWRCFSSRSVSAAAGRRDIVARKIASVLRAGGWLDFTVRLTKAEVLVIQSEFISRSTWGMPAGYSFGSAPSPGRKKSTNTVRALGFGPLYFVPDPLIGSVDGP